MRDALDHITRYTYDANNNRIALIDANGHTTAYAFDALNRLQKITDSLGYATSYTYDPVGNVTVVTDANGAANTFAYDKNNRLTSIAYGDGNSVAYAYDANGNRVSMVDDRGTTGYSYDALDRLVEVNHPEGMVNYGYDAVGNRTSLTYPDGRIAGYSYDALNRPTRVIDRDGRATTYTYDAASNLLQVAYPNGTAISYQYDAANRLVSVANVRGSKLLSSYSYALDALGNRIQMIRDGKFVTSYGYDALSQLISFVAPSGVRTNYNYDPAGNLLTVAGPGQPTQFTYDAANRLLRAGKKTFTHDANGNRISMDDGVVTEYSYDAANRLIQVSRGGRISTYEYDGDGNKVGWTLDAETHRFTNDVATALPVIITEDGPSGIRQYVYGLGLISQTGPGFEYFYHYDGLGNVVKLTDSAGGPTAVYEYDPWGAQEKGGHAATDENRFRFTGEELDDFSGLYYLRARWYDPSVGRFLTPDPLRGVVTFPLSKNRYPYAFSNPVRFTDASGLFPSIGVIKFFTSFGKLIGTAQRDYPINEMLGACYSDLGSCENAPELLLRRQHNLQELSRNAAEVTLSAVDVVYNPTLNGLEVSTEFKQIKTLIDILKNLEWIKEIFRIPTAEAPSLQRDLCPTPSPACVNSTFVPAPPLTPQGKK